MVTNVPIDYRSITGLRVLFLILEKELELFGLHVW